MADKLKYGTYESVDPEFTAVKPSAERLSIAAANAAPGQTAEDYLASRGGINAAGYYGDSWNAKLNLTDEEYFKALNDAKAAGLTGDALGAAINEATAKKRGMSLYDYTGGYQGSKTGASTGTKTGLSGSTTGQDADTKARQSAYDLLYAQFKQYGLESLVEGIKDLIKSNVSPSEFSIRLQDTEAYKKRFAANQDRIKAGLRALTPAEYIGLEDQYQNIMRNYGLPASYYSKDSMGTQAGFNKFIANDVSAAELEDRIATAQKRVLNADVNVMNALKQFYPDITNADILAYTLDPSNALENIKRRVTAAEIGGAALGQGLMTSAASAEDLAKYGITKAQAQQGYQVIGEILPTGQKLADIYEKQQLGPYSQLLAEQEVFGTQGAVDAARKRRKLVELEKATFMGTSGQAQGALDRGRQGSF